MDIKETIERYNDLLIIIKFVIENIQEKYTELVESNKDNLLDEKFVLDRNSIFTGTTKTGREILIDRNLSNPFNEEYVDSLGKGDFDGYAYYTDNNTIMIHGYSESDCNGYGGSCSDVELTIELLESSGDTRLKLINDYANELYDNALSYIERLKEDKEVEEKQKSNTKMKRDLTEIDRLKEIYPEYFK